MNRSRRGNILVNIDWITVAIYLILVFLGWINIYSATYNESHVSIFDISQKYGKQLIWIGAAIIIAIFTLIIDSKFYSSFAYVLYAVGILLLLSVLFFGIEVNASKSWFQIGDFRIQPVEFTKITVCLALARLLSDENFSFNKLSDIIRTAIIFALPIILIFLQNDTGSALMFFSFIFVLFRQGMNKVIFITSFALVVFFILALVIDLEILLIISLVLNIIGFTILNKHSNQKQIVFYTSLALAIASYILHKYTNIFVDKTLTLVLINTAAIALLMLVLFIIKKNKTILLFLTTIIGITIFVLSVDFVFNNVLQPHQQNRINDLLGISSDPLGAGYNVNQSKIAIGSGGLTGKGFLKGTQTKYNFVPEQSTDFIFCTIGEEWGFLGSSLVLFLFCFLILRLIFLSERQRSVFSRIYGYGVVSILFFHVAINIGMTIGLAPVIGIPLPFFSYGGSSLWAFTILLFIFIKLDSDRLQIFR